MALYFLDSPLVSSLLDKRNAQALLITCMHMHHTYTHDAKNEALHLYRRAVAVPGDGRLWNADCRTGQEGGLVLQYFNLLRRVAAVYTGRYYNHDFEA